MIRQAIACDICGADKRQTNHWFIAVEQSGEFRVSRWSTERKSHRGAKHLCGQTCLHRLLDDFIAGVPLGRVGDPAEEPMSGAAGGFAGFGAVGEDGDGFESSARLITPRPHRVDESLTLPRTARATAREATRESTRIAGRKSDGRAGQSDESHAAANAGSHTPNPPAYGPASAPRPQIAAVPEPARFPQRQQLPPDPAAQARPTQPRTTASSAANHSGAMGPVTGLTRGAVQLAAPPEHLPTSLRAMAESSAQRRRAEAWERERAREAGSAQGTMSSTVPRTRMGGA